MKIKKDEEKISRFLKIIGVLYKVKWSDELSFNEKCFLFDLVEDDVELIVELASIESEFAGTGDFRERVTHHGFWRVSPKDILFNRMGIENDAPSTWNPQCAVIFRPIGSTSWYYRSGDLADLKEEYLWKLRVLPHEYYDTTYNHFALAGWHYASEIEIPDGVEIRQVG